MSTTGGWIWGVDLWGKGEVALQLAAAQRQDGSCSQKTSGQVPPIIRILHPSRKSPPCEKL